MAAVLLVISSGSPAMAATPQEGWFIAGEETLDGIDYWVIDNKLNMDPWLVQCATQRIPVEFDEVELNASGDHTYLSGWFDEVLYSQLFYRGYSDSSWRVDNDWVVKIWAEDTTSDLPYQVVIFDRTQVPLVNYRPIFTTGSSSSRPQGQFTNPWSLEQSTSACIPFKYNDDWGALFASSRGNTGKWTYWELGYFQMYSVYGLPVRLNGSDINDICVSITYGRGKDNSLYSQTVAESLIQKKIALQWLCPKDKAPSGMQIGDYWPKHRPLEVVMQDAYDAYKQTMLNNGQIKDPSDINTMFGQLGGMQEDGLGALDFGEDEATVLPGVISIIQPVITFLFPFFGLVLILLIFANKGIHG